MILNFITYLRRCWEQVKDSPFNYRLAVGAFWSISGSVISRGISLLAFIVVARMLGKVAFGELGIIQSTVVTFGTIAGYGFGMSATKYIASYRQSDKAKVGKILALLSLFSGITATVVSLSLLISASILATKVMHAPQLTKPLIIGSGAVFISVINGVQVGALAGFQVFKVIAKVNFIAGIASFAFIISGAYFGGVSGAVTGLAVSNCFNWWLNNRVLNAHCRELAIARTYSGCMSEIMIIWEFAIPSALSSFLVAPASWLANVLLVNSANGYAEMGVFSAAQQWQSAILFLPAALAPMILSMLARSHDENEVTEYRKTVNASFAINIALAGSAAVIIYLLSPIIMGSYGKGFVQESRTLSLLCFSAFLMATSYVIGQVIASSASMWWGFFLNLLWAGAFLGFALLFVKPYGAFGLAGAYAASYFCHLIWTSLYVYRKQGFLLSK